MHYSTHTICAVKPPNEISEWDILSSLPIALVILSAQGRVLWLNPSAEVMLGYELIGLLWLDVIPRAFVTAVDDGDEVFLADGRLVYVEISALDSLPGTLVTLSDITATRDYEKAKENESRLVLIGTMTAQLAHQIRTPLSSAMLYTEHLTSLPDLNERSQNWIRRLGECHASIERQIQDVLLFARGTLIEFQRIDMGFFCSQLIQRAQPYVDTYSASLTVNNQLITTEALVHGESLIGAILNLIINALQSEATEIDLTLASMGDSGIQISVEDNGSGMSEEVKERAFSPFYTTKAQGSGLGLAVVFAVVEAHQGSITLESSEGVGTQVNLCVPGENKA